MTDNNKFPFEQTYEDDPNRCQGITGNGQCTLKALDGSKFCAAHGGNRALETKKKESLSTYRLTKWQVRLGEMSGHDRLKNLADEIGILRILMEELINKTDDKLGLIQYAPQIADLAMKICKLVEACTKLDRLLSQYISKNDAVQLGMEIVTIISNEIKEIEKLDIISGKIVEVIERIASE